MNWASICQKADRHWCVKRLPAAFEGLEAKTPAMVIEALRGQLELIEHLTHRVEDIERKLDVYRFELREKALLVEAIKTAENDMLTGKESLNHRMCVCILDLSKSHATISARVAFHAAVQVSRQLVTAEVAALRAELASLRESGNSQERRLSRHADHLRRLEDRRQKE